MMAFFKKNRNNILLILISLIAFTLDFIYFYRVSNDYYLADIAPHIDAAKAVLELKPIVLHTKRVSTVGYPLFHVLTSILSIFLNSNYRLSGVLILTVLKLSVFVACVFLDRQLCKATNIKGNVGFFNDVSILSLSYVACLPLTGELYLPQGSPNVWHNPTYIAMQPFALLMFYYAYKSIESEKIIKKNYVLLAFTSIMTCISKPSFIVVIVPAGLTYILCETLITRKIYVKKILLISLSLLPTFIILVIQYFITFSDSVSTGIRFGTFLNLSIADAIAATLSVIVFPLLYAVTVRFKFDNPKLMLLAVCSFIVGWLQYFFLYEKENADGNFAWGYFMSIFVLYFSVYMDSKNNKSKKSVVVVVYFIQVIIGLVYFWRLSTRHFYM